MRKRGVSGLLSGYGKGFGLKRKYVNSQAVLESICFLLFGATMLFLLWSGKYLSYVTPRMAPYLGFTVVVSGVMAVVSLRGLFRVEYKKRTGRYFVLILPILLLLLPHKEMAVANLSGTTGLLTGGAISEPSMPAEDENQPQAAEPELPQEQLKEEPKDEPVPEVKADASGIYMAADIYGEPLPLHGYDEVNRTITVNHEEFYDWLNEFFANPDQLEGFQVTMTGAVYKDPTIMKENEFVPARLLMTCCVADLAPCGAICTYEKAAELESDSWVTVTGTLYRVEGQNGLRMQVTSVVPAEPVQGYLYPY